MSLTGRGEIHLQVLSKNLCFYAFEKSATAAESHLQPFELKSGSEQYQTLAVK